MLRKRHISLPNCKIKSNNSMTQDFLFRGGIGDSLSHATSLPYLPLDAV